MKRYNPSQIEPKWQTIWQDEARYQASDNDSREKYYISCMFPYPSGAGMHVGHAFEHAIVDALARFQRAQGKNVMNPMGWDSFGLPAENYAIKTGTAPSVVTKQNIANFTEQLQRMGASIDWSRELNTSSPEYYRWTQWVFTQFYKRGLAYQKHANQWWCDPCQTVLANEQVINLGCWRCDETVQKKPMKQWFFKITDYADSLLDNISDLEWPEKIKTAQKNWIGKSVGAEVSFTTEGDGHTVSVFTTRPDTIFGATYLVLAPEHSLIDIIATDEQRAAVSEYVTAALKRTEIERMSEGKKKTGVFTGTYAINPATNEKIPIWVADYVLGGYGTGAIMAVPAHDERDNAFAKEFDLLITAVVASDEEAEVITGEGTLVNSGQFDGLSSQEARQKIIDWLDEQGVGAAKTTYKMRDWLISRQRYWGAPIPIVHVEGYDPIPVAEQCLPVELPHVEDYAPKGNGSVLETIDEWVRVWVNVETGEIAPITEDKPAGEAWKEGRRETDTMDGYACSSWYLLRYTSPGSEAAAWDTQKAQYWMPVDTYVGGDHAVAHLLYVRFWSHVFADMGLITHAEPVKELVYHGLIQAEDGTKMSKSKGNVVNPLEVIDQGYGADALRTFCLFLGPITDNSNWSTGGVAGVYRFLNRIWTLTHEYIDSDVEKTGDIHAEIRRIQHAATKKVTEDMHRHSFNTAIAALMECVNDLYKIKTDGFASSSWRPMLETLVQLVAPFAPHMAAELWSDLGRTTPLDTATYPTWNDEYLVADTITLAVQVNGRVRAEITVAAAASVDEIKQNAMEETNVAKHINGLEPRKIIVVPKKLVNIVV